jgi:cytidyltransferase-like protein
MEPSYSLSNCFLFLGQEDYQWLIEPPLQLDEFLTKHILSRIYIQTLKYGQFGSSLVGTMLEEGAKPTFMPADLFSDYLLQLQRQGLISGNHGFHSLTPKGRRDIVVVMIGGGFDIIHPGHIDALKRAKSLGDVLVVSVARDSTYKRNKNREAIHPEKLRQELVSSVKFVDAAVLGSEKDIFETVQFLKPDIIALGYDQKHSENAIEEGAAKVGVQCKVVRLTSHIPNIKTSSLITSRNNKELLRDI